MLPELAGIVLVDRGVEELLAKLPYGADAGRLKDALLADPIGVGRIDDVAVELHTLVGEEKGPRLDLLAEKPTVKLLILDLNLMQANQRIHQLVEQVGGDGRAQDPGLGDQHAIEGALRLRLLGRVGIERREGVVAGLLEFVSKRGLAQVRESVDGKAQRGHPERRDVGAVGECCLGADLEHLVVVLPRLFEIIRHLENQRLEPVARRLLIFADGIDHLFDRGPPVPQKEKRKLHMADQPLGFAVDLAGCGP